MNDDSEKELPLEGIKVVSLEQAIAAPLCSRQLADMGARVIKVERPEVGDFARGYDERASGLSSHFVWTNRSKESLTIDLKSDVSKNIMDKLLSDTDILIQNLTPGASERLGLAYEQLKSKFPKLIVCNISGYGDSGSYRLKKAYDLLIQSESGFLSTTGFPGTHGMAKAGCSIADISAGMYAYSSILCALLMRKNTGEGASIDISMLECLVEWMGYPLYYSYDGAPPPGREGASHASIYPYGPFPAGDGEFVMLGVQNDREWNSFCHKVLGFSDLVQDERFLSNSLRSQNRAELNAIVGSVFDDLTASEVCELLDDAGIANAKVNDMHDVWNHPQLRDRGHWTSIGSPVGNLPATRPPGKSTAFTPFFGPVPDVGEHSEKILAELGFNGSQLKELRDDGII